MIIMIIVIAFPSSTATPSLHPRFDELVKKYGLPGGG